MDLPLSIKLENARGIILNAIQEIQNKYKFPAYIMDGIFSQIISEIRAEEKIELINDTNQMIRSLQEKEEKKWVKQPI